jgi:hypothetical protein
MGSEIELQARLLILKCAKGLSLPPLSTLEIAKKSLQLAFELTDLTQISEVAFIIATLSNQVNDKLRVYKRDAASQLYLATQLLI